MRHASHCVVIRRNADGVTLVCLQPYEWVHDEDGGSSYFYWAEGNNSCDCNRFLEFERGMGNDPSLDDDRCQCSSGSYDVLRFDFPDGTSMPGPDAAV